MELENDFSEEEIKRAIWNLEYDRAPGPDGFPIFFFQIFWSAIKEDFLNMFKELNKEAPVWID